MKPGSSVASPRSITRAPGGHGAADRRRSCSPLTTTMRAVLERGAGGVEHVRRLEHDGLGGAAGGIGRRRAAQGSCSRRQCSAEDEAVHRRRGLEANASRAPLVARQSEWQRARWQVCAAAAFRSYALTANRASAAKPVLVRRVRQRSSAASAARPRSRASRAAYSSPPVASMAATIGSSCASPPFSIARGSPRAAAHCRAAAHGSAAASACPRPGRRRGSCRARLGLER